MTRDFDIHKSLCAACQWWHPPTDESIGLPERCERQPKRVTFHAVYICADYVEDRSGIINGVIE